MLDRTGELLWMNPAAENLLGLSLRQVQSHRLEQIWANAGPLVVAIQDVVVSHQTLKFRELSLEQPNGPPLVIDCTLSTLPPALGMGDVIMEIQLAERSLARDAEQEAQQRLAHRLIVNLAHELRNPLAGLRGATQLLERELPQSDLKEYTRVILGETDRLGALVNQLLGPQQPPRKRPTNLHRPIEHVRRLLAAEADARLTIERDYDPSLPPVNVDADQLVQALLNLGRNALQALAQTPAPRISLRTRINPNQVIAGQRHRLCTRISVIDNGPGIPADRIERIFFPMVSGHNQQTGLGLSIARSLVSANGGRLQCTSQPGATEFTIDLPLERPS